MMHLKLIFPPVISTGINKTQTFVDGYGGTKPLILVLRRLGTEN